MNLDKFLLRTRSKDYNCLDFVRDVWLDITGEDLGVDISVGKLSWHRHFNKLEQPKSPCLVIMLDPEPHIGVFLYDKIIHLKETVQYQPVHVATFGHKIIRYYQ